MATGSSIHSDILNQVAKGIQEKLKDFDSHRGSEVGGSEKLAKILNLLQSKTGKNILSELEKRDINLAARIKDEMFTFADILNIEDNSLRRALIKIPNDLLALALKDESDEMKQKFFTNISDNRKKILLSELRTLGPQRRSDIQAAKNKIITILKNLQEIGELFFKGRDKGDEWVY